MKIAVCFSGATRNFEDTFPYFQKNLFNEYDVDIFIFGVPNKNGIEQNLESLNKLYNPKKIILNEYEFYNELDKKYNWKDPIAKMWYNIYHSNKLREEYELKNNFKYDCVFRMRFDYFFLRKLSDINNYNPIDTYVDISLSILDDNSLFIPDRWNFSSLHTMAKTDMFSIGNSVSMTKYCNLFENIDTFIKKPPKNHNGSPHPESLLGIYLNSIGLNVIPIHSPFEFEYPEEIDISSNDISYRANYRKFAF